MPFISKLLRGLWYVVWYGFAATIVLLAAVFGLARLLLPVIGDYNRDIEKYATDYVKQPVKIMSLDAEWHGLSPSLILNNVRLLSSDGTETLLTLARARLDFDLLSIARTGKVQFSRFALSGANLSIARLPDGQFNLAGFETSKIETAGNNDNNQGIQWLLSQGELELHARNLIFNDQMKDHKRYHFSNVSLSLKNRGNRHMISGAIGFAEKTGQDFSFALDVRGDITALDAWSGTLYLNGTNLDFARLFGELQITGNTLSVGRSNFEIWSDWKNASLVGLRGDISLDNIKCETKKGATPLLAAYLPAKVSPVNDENLTPQPSPTTVKPANVSYDHLIGRFVWDRYEDGWRLTSDRLVIGRHRIIWPTSQFAMHYFKDRDAFRRLQLKASLIRIEALTPLLPVLFGNYQGYAAKIGQIAPQGDVKNVNFDWREKDSDYQLAANLENIGFANYNKLPGMQGLSGTLRANKEKGSFVFNTRQSEFYMPTMFRWEIPVTRVNGRLDWQANEQEVFVSSRNLELDTAHFQSKAVFDINIPKSDASPFVNLIAQFSNADASKASYYYPVSIMGEKALKWLDTAIVQGTVGKGGAIVYGPLREFPFTKGQGVFDVRFEVEDALLDYAEDWPPLHGAHAMVKFLGNTLSVKADRARIFDSNVKNVNVSVPSLAAKPLQLNISGNINGKLQNNINYLLTAPPLQKQFEKSMSDLRAEGNSELELDIGLSIGETVDAKVSGKLDLHDNKIEMVQVSGLLSHVNGSVYFSDGGIRGNNIKAHLINQPVTVKIATKELQMGRRGETVKYREYRAVGKFNAKSLSQAKFPFMNDMVEGDSNWVVKLLVPQDKAKSVAGENMQIDITTDLKGVELNLPPPFNKTRAESRKLNVLAMFKDADKTLIRTSYANTFEGLLECKFTDPQWPSRGELHFGGGPVVLPGGPGLRVAGHMKELSYDIWENLIRQVLAQIKKQPSSGVQQTDNRNRLDFSILHSADLVADKFEIFGQVDANASIKVENKKSWLAVNIKSKKFDGNITIPEDLDNKPIELDMQYIKLSPLEESGAPLKAKQLPAIKLNSRSVTYGNKKLGHVAIQTAKSEKGLLLQQLIIKPRATIIKGHGSWFDEQGSEQSFLALDVESEDLGKTMKDLGYVETVDDGKGKITANLSWPAGLIDPDLNHISGDVKLALKNGRILDIEPGGAARLFGLFSLQTLPRRLMLDFSDIFSKGLGFDSINGQFKLEDGNAYTSNLQMKGPNADALLSGRIGLGEQDYDQKIRVTPHITDTTILLSIITSQPLLLFLQQLLKQDIDAATSFEYTLTGSWDNYELKPVLKQPPPAPPEPDDF